MDQLQTIAQVNRRFAYGVAFLVLALLFVIPVDLQLSKIPNTLDEQYISEHLIIPIEKFFPEQAERAQFLFTVIALPVLIFIFGILNSRWKFLDYLTVRNQNFIVYISSLLIILLACLDFKLYGLYYFTLAPLDTHPLVTLGVGIVFIIGTFYFNRWIYASSVGYPYKLINYVYFLLVIVLFMILLPILVARKADLGTTYFSDGSFDAYFYPIVQVIKGKTILVDFNSQYGLYPYFLLPIIKLLGLDITTFSLLLIFLYIVFLVMFLLILEKLVRNPWIKFLCILTFGYLFHVLGLFHTTYYYYYQYVPHRVLFPALILLVCLYYYRGGKPKRILYLLGFLVSSISIWWNLDTGIPVFGAWLLSLLFNEFVSNADRFKQFLLRSLQHILVATVFIVSSGALILGYTIYRSGQFPDIKSFLFYQGLFYGSGYFMMPMPIFHPWNLVIIVYIAGIIQSITYLISRLSSDHSSEAISDPDHWKRMMIFVLSILGVGLFSYYQGRSHPSVILAVLWPALLLVAIYINDLGNLLSQVKWINFSKHFNQLAGLTLVYACMVFLFFSFGTGTISNLLFLIGNSDSQFSPALSLYPEYFQSEIDFIHANTKLNESALILAVNAGVLYAETNSYDPLPLPQIIEFLSREDLMKIITYANDPVTEKLFVEQKVLSRYPILLENLSKSHLKMTGKDKSGNLVLYSSTR